MKALLVTRCNCSQLIDVNEYATTVVVPLMNPPIGDIVLYKSIPLQYDAVPGKDRKFKLFRYDRVKLLGNIAIYLEEESNV